MPRPSTTPTWATDANYPAGSDAWSATPTRVEPTAPQKGTGVVPATRPPAQFMNWIWGLLADWVAYFASIIDSDDEHTYPTPKTRTIWVPGMSFEPSSMTVLGVPETENWSIPGGSYTRQSSDDVRYCALDVTQYLRSGQTLTRADVLVDPGAQRGAGSRLTVYLTRHDFPTPPAAAAAAPTVLDQDEQATVGHALQYIVLTTSETITRSDDVLQLLIESGNDGAHQADILHGAYLTFTDVGPRNA